MVRMAPLGSDNDDEMATPDSHSASSNYAYNTAYKGISVVLKTMTRLLSGGYVNFGVFSLYQDPALENALQTAIRVSRVSKQLI